MANFDQLLVTDSKRLGWDSYKDTNFGVRAKKETMSLVQRCGETEKQGEEGAEASDVETPTVNCIRLTSPPS